MPGAVDVGLSTKGQKPELDVQLDRGAGRLARRHRRPGRAGAAPRVRRHRRRRLGRSRRRDARRDGPARARVARSASRDLESLPLSLVGRRAAPVTLPLGQVAHDHASDRAGADRPPRSRARDHRRGEHRGPRRCPRWSSDIEARVGRRVHAAAGYTLRQGGETEDQEEVFAQMLRRARRRGAADVLRSWWCSSARSSIRSRSCCRCRCR